MKHSLAPSLKEKPPEDDSLRAKIVKVIAKALGKENLISKRRRSAIPQYVWDAEPKLRRPRVDYVTLVEWARNNWVLRRVFNAIIRECTRNWGHIEPKFRMKCEKCGTEFQSVVDKCPICKVKKYLREPSAAQKKRLELLTTKPSPDRTFYEFIRSTLFYLLATDDFYWSIVYKHVAGKGETGYIAEEVHVEHPGYIFPIGDERGYLGGYQYFCPRCYYSEKYKGQDLVWDIRQESLRVQESKIFKCPICGEIMVQTCYVQEVAGKVIARFGRNEIVHGSMSRLPPELFGNSKLISLVKILETLNAIDDYQLEVHTEGKIGGLLVFPGLDQDRVGQILQDVKAEREELTQRDLETGEYESKKRTALIFVGLEEGDKPVKIPFIDEEEAKQTLEYYQLYMNAVDSVYGLDTTISTRKRGSTREVRTKIEVKRETAQEYQRLIEETLNNELLPLFGITDWKWVFNPLESKDKLRDAEVLHQTMAAAVTARNAGFNVKFQDGVLTIWGEAEALEENKSRVGVPNVEPGVAPRRVSREFVTPVEISPYTGEEVLASTFSERLSESLLDILEEARQRSHEGKGKLNDILHDARAKLFRALSRANLRLDKKEALYAKFDKLLMEIVSNEHS